jgi:serine phosphatase RsbU (regulator of sigma subunit)
MDARRRTQSTSSRDTKARARATTSWILRERPQPSASIPVAAPATAILQPHSGELPSSLLERLISDPHFLVTSADRTHWICPFTGRAVPISGGRLATARAYLERSGVWRNLAPLSSARLEIERWRYDISVRLAHEARLRLFSRQGLGWINPYNGSLHASVRLEDGTLTPHTITCIAAVLANCPEARLGVMLPQDELMRRYETLQRSGTTEDETETEHTDTTEVVPLEDPADLAASQPQNEDLSQARRVQARSFCELPNHQRIALGVHFAPCAGVSGDLYHVTILPDNRLLLMVGDVSGHGVQAALVVAAMLKTLRYVLRTASDPVDIALACNDELREDLLPGQFISAYFAVIDATAMTLTALCAGHHPALLVNHRREFPVRRVGRSGMALGLGNRETLTRMLRPVTIPLEPGDILVQATDGLLEAFDSDHNEWGEARWMGSTLSLSESKSPQEIADGLVQDCHGFTKRPIDDDLTIIVARLTADESN